MSPRDRTQVGVLVVDDQTHFRRVALDVVDATPGFEPVGEASSGAEALGLADELDPELVLMDVRMPGMDGVETSRLLSSAHPDLVIVLVSIDEPEDLPSTAGCGATTLVRKQSFGPLALRRLWGAYGKSALHTQTVAE